MGNFLRRSLAFILGMVFGFVVLATGIVIAGYYAYKNLSLSSVGVNEEVVDLGDLNNATFEELVALVTSASKDPSSYTFADLEEDYGLDVDGFLTSMGLDVNSIHPDDVKAFKQLSPFSLAVEGGADKFLQNINLGVVFGFIPKDESGVYPIFSEGARSKLRAYTIGDLMKSDEETGESKVLEVLGAIKFGGILSSSFNESYDATTAEYNYTAIESGFLDSLGNLSFSAISGITSGEELDIGFELNEGIFKDLGCTTIGELMGLEGGEGDALAIAFGDKKLGDIFVKNGDVYEFDIMNLLNSVKVGALMGMHECNGEGDCSVGHSDHVNGWYDGGGNYIEDSDIGGELMTNLYSLTIENLTNGSFDIVSLTDGIYLGKALGYSIGVNGDYCGEGCDIDQTNPDHKHEYYWVDGSGDYAGALNNSISNISINDVMNGELSIDSLFDDVYLGELMGNTYCNGTSCSLSHGSHVEGWYDGSQTLIDGNDIAGELMINLYGLKVSELMDGSFDIVSLTDGIFLGKAFGYTYCDGISCSLSHDNHVKGWYDESGYVGAMNNSLANIKIADVMNGSLVIEDVIGGVYLGELMGNTYCDGTSCNLSHSHVEGWYDGSNNLISATDTANEIMLKLYDLTVTELMNGDVDLVSLTDGIYLGKAFGYTYCDGISCSLSHDNHVKGWYDESGYVGAMNNSLANIKIADVMNGSLVIEDVIGGIYLGELMGNTYCNGTSCNLLHSHVEGWYDGSNNLITATDTANEIMLKLYDITVTELMNNGIDMASLTSGIYLGKAMGYTYCDGISCSLSHDNHVKGWYDESGYVGAMNNSLADIEISSVMNGGLNINDVIGGLKLGEVMGNVYCDGNSCSLSHGSHAIGWYKKDGSFINPNDIEATDKIVYNLYLTSLSDIMNGSFDIESAISDMYVGELMGYDGTVNAWTNGGVSVSSLENVIANIKMSEMLNGDLNLQEKIKDVKLGDVMSNTSSSSVLKLLEGTSINDLPTAIDALKIGQIMGYTQYTHCSAGSSCSENHSHWYNGTKLVTGIYGALSSYSIKSITEGNIANLKIGDVIEVGDNKVLQLLAGSSLTSVATDANAIQIGKVMGYELNADDGKWYTDTNYTTPIDGLEGKIASYTIEEISNGALSNLINNLTIGDVLTDTSAGAFGLIYQGALTEGGASYEGNTGAIPVTELSERMLKGFKEASYSALEGAGVISLTDEEKEKITYFYANIFTGEKPTDWKTEKTLPEVIKDIISIIKIL